MRAARWMPPLIVAVAVLDCAAPARAESTRCADLPAADTGPCYLRARDPAPRDGEHIPSPVLARLLKADAGRRSAEGATRAARAERDRIAGGLVAERALREADRIQAEKRDREWAATLERCETTARESLQAPSLWASPYLWGGAGLAIGAILGATLAGAW